MTTYASILAVGSELLCGQISNGNAAWLSSKLFAIGIDTKRHLTVDDIEAEITAAITALTKDVDLLLITGGLGPTSDDLTRNGVAAWAGLPLQFHQASWDRIEQIFQRLGAPAGDSNRQQCYFPQGATVLVNEAGTANGFMIQAHGKEVWVLPGPPKEVEAIWLAHARQALTARTPAADRKVQRKWRTIGKGESQLAELVSPLFVGHQDLEIAYRVHAPYVELKLRFPAHTATRYQAVCSQIEQVLRPWLFESDEFNTPEALVERLIHFASVDIYDGVTQGHLSELLAPHLRNVGKEPRPITLMTSWEGHEDPAGFVEQALTFQMDTEVALAIAGINAQGGWAVGLRLGEQRFIEERPSFYRGDTQRPRNLKAIASLAAKAWFDLLTSELN
jgi:molybdenum cofactor synthesis domain-containing protein